MGIEAAIIGSALIGGGAALAGGSKAAKASRQAADVQARSTDKAIVEQRRQAQQSQANLAPFLATSQAADAKLANLFGLTPPQEVVPTVNRQTTPSAATTVRSLPRASGAIEFDGEFSGGGLDNNLFFPDGRSRITNPFVIEQMQNEQPQNLGLIDTPIAGAPMGTQVAPSGGDTPSGLDIFTQSPGFQFRQSEGEKAINRANSARGRFFSGAAVEDLTEFNSGLASDEFNTFFNQLNALRTGGSSAAGASTAAGAQSAGNVANLIQTGGANRASGIVGAGNAANQGLAGAGTALSGGLNNLAFLNAQPTPTPTTIPTPILQQGPVPQLDFIGG